MRLVKMVWVVMVAAIMTLFFSLPLAASAEFVPPTPPPPQYPPTTGNG